MNKEAAARRGGSGGIGEGCKTQIVIVNSDEKYSQFSSIFALNRDLRLT